ncbi:MAG: TIGR03067 domain-containing protein [Isosphaeraceae bacterium]
MRGVGLRLRSRVGFALLVFAAGVSRGDTIQEELSRLQGTWNLVSAETDGEPAPADRIKNVRVVIKGSTSTVYFGETLVAHSDQVKINPGPTPHEVDDYPSGPGLDGKVIRGIYKVEGDSLTSCVGKLDGDRPKTFAAPKGSGFTLRAFRRAKSESDAVKAEQKKLEGRWFYVEIVHEGRALPSTEFINNRLEFRGDQFISEDSKDNFHGTYTIDPTARPKTIDMTFREGPARGKTYLGIYELVDDTCKFCLALPGLPRPSEFKSRLESGSGIRFSKRSNEPGTRSVRGRLVPLETARRGS